MQKKILGIFICMLLIVTALPSVGTLNLKEEESVLQNANSTTTDVVWFDNFDSYSLGQFLNGTPDDGGWEIWNGAPELVDGAYVVDNQSRSNPHSVEIVGNSDIVHQFTRICSGNWTVKEWVYVPANFSDYAALFLMSYYPNPDGGDYWQLVVEFSGETGLVGSYPSGPTLPLITDQWVEIRIEIDFEADWLECYYNDELLVEKNWTEDYHGPYYNPGFRNLAAVDISWNYHGPKTPIYHDDFSIEGEAGPDHELNCEGRLSWIDVKAGQKVKGNFTVENIGEPNSRLEWIIDETPEFGQWSVKPFYGSLKPEDGPFTVEVTGWAPHATDEKFTGEFKLRAICDPDETCTIDVYLSTPKNKAHDFNFNLFAWLFERFPNVFPILRYLQRL